MDENETWTFPLLSCSLSLNWHGCFSTDWTYSLRAVKTFWPFEASKISLKRWGEATLANNSLWSAPSFHAPPLPTITPLYFHPIVFSSFLSLVFVGLFLASRNQRSVQITGSVLGKKLTQKLFLSPWAVPHLLGTRILKWWGGKGRDARGTWEERTEREVGRRRERKLICPVSGTVLAFTQLPESEEFPG